MSVEKGAAVGAHVEQLEAAKRSLIEKLCDHFADLSPDDRQTLIALSTEPFDEAIATLKGLRTQVER